MFEIFLTFFISGFIIGSMMVIIPESSLPLFIILAIIDSTMYYFIFGTLNDPTGLGFNLIFISIIGLVLGGGITLRRRGFKSMPKLLRR